MGRKDDSQLGRSDSKIGGQSLVLVIRRLFGVLGVFLYCSFNKLPPKIQDFARVPLLFADKNNQLFVVCVKRGLTVPINACLFGVRKQNIERDFPPFNGLNQCQGDEER
jgi:hypothetical protein